MASRPSQAEALQLPHGQCTQCALFVAQPPAPLIADGRAKPLLVCPACGGSLREGKDGEGKDGVGKAGVGKDGDAYEA